MEPHAVGAQAATYKEKKITSIVQPVNANRPPKTFGGGKKLKRSKPPARTLSSCKWFIMKKMGGKKVGDSLRVDSRPGTQLEVGGGRGKKKNKVMPAPGNADSQVGRESKKKKKDGKGKTAAAPTGEKNNTTRGADRKGEKKSTRRRNY